MSRSLHDIPAGASVILDANVIIYALTPPSQFHISCRELLERGGARLAQSVHQRVGHR